MQPDGKVVRISGFSAQLRPREGHRDDQKRGDENAREQGDLAPVSHIP